MLNDVLHSKIFALADCYNQAFSTDFAQNELLLTLNNNFEQVTDKLKLKNILFENISNNEISIKCNIENIGMKIFVDTENFLNTCKSFYETFNNNFSDFAILNHRKHCIIYDPNNKKYFSNSEFEKTYFVSNSLSYLNLQSYFISNKFSEYHNNAINEIVYFSNSKGIYHLKFPRITPILDEKKDYSIIITSTLTELESKEYNLLFKDLLFDFVKSKSENGFVDVISKLESINSETNRNFQIVLKKFSFETLKSELQKKKEEYFNSTREILSKVFSQVVTVPISISASVFATYKVNDIFTLYLILFSFLAYSIFVSQILFVYLKEIRFIEKDIFRQLKIIKDNSGLPIIEILEGEQIIINRINIVKKTIYLFLFIISLLTLAFIFFIKHQILLTILQSLSIYLIQIVVQLVVAYYSSVLR